MAKNTQWLKLEAADQQWIGEQIHRLLPDLRSYPPRHRAWAYDLIDELLWFWTADAVHPDGVVRRDAIKHDPRYVHHSSAALATLADGAKTKDEKVQHEHASERAEIIDVLEKHARSAEDVIEILTHLNFAVLVTRKEHRELGKRSWGDDWRQREWRAHYAAKGIAIQPPTGGR